MRGGGMFCPKERDGCGKLLEWDDGAFCKECMSKALYQRWKEMNVKEIVDWGAEIKRIEKP